jgi:hypothetical protein
MNLTETGLITQIIHKCKQELRDHNMSVPVHTNNEYFELVLDAIRDIGRTMGQRSYNEIIVDFKPYQWADDTAIDSTLYENEDNVKVLHALQLADTAGLSGSINTFPIEMGDNIQLAVMYFNANAKNTDDTHTIEYDVSLDNPPITNTSKTATWLVGDSILTSILPNVYIDLSAYVTPYFSMKFTLTTDDEVSPLLYDVRIKCFNMNLDRVSNYQSRIVNLACAKSYRRRIADAIVNGAKDSRIEKLESMEKYHTDQVTGESDGARKDDNIAVSKKWQYNKYADLFRQDSQDVLFTKVSNGGVRLADGKALGYPDWEP